MFSTWNRMMSGVAFSAEDGTGSAPAPAADAAPATAADTGSVLYPDDPPPAAEGAAKDGDDDAAGNDEGADEGEGNKDGEPDPLDLVPEDGKYNVELPEGMEVDAALLDRFSPKFKEAGLTQRQVQAITSEFAAMRKEEMDGISENWSKTVTEWADTAKADAEIGGAKWNDTVRNASGVVARFGTPELKEYLNSSGGGNHPEMIRFMAKVGALIGEDNPAISENPGKKVARDTAEVLYPNDQPKGK